MLQRMIKAASVALWAVCLTVVTLLHGCSGGTVNEQQVLQIIKNNPDVVVEALQAYQRKQQADQQQAQQDIGRKLIDLHRNPDALIGSSPVTGARDRKILLVEFSDFQCPFCARAHDTVKQFMAEHDKEVTFTYKHLPLVQIHQQAMPAAYAAWAAGQQGKFWQYHDELFANQPQLGEELYVSLAKKLRLDLNRFNHDRNSPDAQAAIQTDLGLADRLGLGGTPFFSMNGIPLNGAQPLQAFEQVLAQIKQE